jgi:hypothetical protein
MELARYLSSGRVAAPNPGHANLLLEQFGGPQGGLAAAADISLKLSADDPAGKICCLTSPVAILNKGCQ